jgi:hypothetical protein
MREVAQRSLCGDWSHAAMSQGKPGAIRSWKSPGRIFLPFEFLEGAQPCQHLNFKTQILWDNTFLLLEAPTFMTIFCGSLKKLTEGGGTDLPS